jgi:molecular chaperone GrpE
MIQNEEARQPEQAEQARAEPAESGDDAPGADTAAEAVGATGGEAVDAAVALAAAQAQAEAERERALRAAAELENVRRRAERDVENAHRYGVERFARELLGVKDSLEMGLKSANEAGDAAAVVDGLTATLKLLGQCFEKHGIEEIDPAGDAFDPDAHEAMATQPSDEAPANSVLLVVQKGYRLHERLLRPARVIVARAPD